MVCSNYPSVHLSLGLGIRNVLEFIWVKANKVDLILEDFLLHYNLNAFGHTMISEEAIMKYSIKISPAFCFGKVDIEIIILCKTTEKLDEIRQLFSDFGQQAV